jgi:hypothetical protein
MTNRDLTTSELNDQRLAGEYDSEKESFTGVERIYQEDLESSKYRRDHLKDHAMAERTINDAKAYYSAFRRYRRQYKTMLKRHAEHDAYIASLPPLTFSENLRDVSRFIGSLVITALLGCLIILLIVWLVA